MRPIVSRSAPVPEKVELRHLSLTQMTIVMEATLSLTTAQTNSKVRIRMMSLLALRTR